MVDLLDSTFEFDSEFEFKVLALCCRDRTFLSTYRRILQPSFFSDPRTYLIASSIFSHFDDYENTVDQADLRQTVKLKGKKTSQEKVAIESMPVIDRMYAMPIEDTLLVADMITEFVDENIMAETVLECADMLDDKKRTSSTKAEILEKVEKAAKHTNVVKHDPYTLMTNLDADVDVLCSPKENAAGISTGFSHLDQVMKNGGLCPGHLGELEGPQKRFKSGLMVNFAHAAARAPYGRNVVIYTLELTELEYIERLRCRVSTMSISEIRKDPDKFKTIIQNQASNGLIAGQILVVYMEADVATLDDIKSHQELLKKEGFKTDLVLIDYLDLVAPRVRMGANGRRFEIDTLYRATKTWAVKEQIALWTPGQSQGAASRAKIVTEENSSESKGKNRIVDIKITLNQTPEEYGRNEMRLHIVCNRHGEQWGFVRISTEPKHMYAKSLEYIKPGVLSEDDIESKSADAAQGKGRGNNTKRDSKPKRPKTEI